MNQKNNQVESASGEVAKTSLYFIAVIIIIASLIYWYWQKNNSINSEPNIDDTASLQTKVNLSEKISFKSPTEDIPELNPAKTANPFSDVYKNPFE